MSQTVESHRGDVTLLFSGGLDSTACLHYYRTLGYAVRPLFVDYGQPAVDAERRAAREIAAEYGETVAEVSCGGLEVPRSGLIVGRNGLLIFAATVWSGERTSLIGLGLHAGTPYVDSHPDFIREVDRLITRVTACRQKVDAPFINWSKAAIWNYAVEVGLPIHLTYSCEASSIRPCGICASCVDRTLLNVAS